MSVTINPNLVLSGGAGAAPASAGQVFEFVAGQVPDGFVQVGGLSPVADAGRYSPDSIYYRDDAGQLNGAYAYRWKLIAAGQRLFGIGSNPSVNTLCELDATTLVQKDAGVAVSSTGASSGSRHVTLIPLADGRLFRIGGSESGTVSNICQLYNPGTRSFSFAASAPMSVVPTYTAAAQAGDGNIYGMFASTATGYLNVSCYSPIANSWTHPVATAPLSSDLLIDIAKLPSGKLLFVYTTAQYVFDPADFSFTLLSGRTFSVNAAVLSMTNAVRIYSGDSRTNRMAYVDFTDVGPSADVITNVMRPYRESTLRLSAAQSPVTGDIFIKPVMVSASTATSDEMLRISMGYQPAVTVKAMKV